LTWQSLTLQGEIMDRKFTKWLLDEMDERHWNMSDLAQQAGLSQPTISLVMSEARRPGLEFCIGVAKAFKLPPERVLRRASLLPPVTTEDDATIQDLSDILRRLPPDALEEAIWFLNALYSRES
jgi:transcriptional regulator with XRE-family HTH domain